MRNGLDKFGVLRAVDSFDHLVAGVVGRFDELSFSNQRNARIVHNLLRCLRTERRWKSIDRILSVLVLSDVLVGTLHVVVNLLKLVLRRELILPQRSR